MQSKLMEITRVIQSLSLLVAEAETHTQVEREILQLPVRPCHPDLKMTEKKTLQGRVQRTLVEIHTVHEQGRRVWQRDKELAQAFG